MDVELVNAVAGGELGASFDLHMLSSRLSQYSPNYEPEVSPGLYFELPDTQVTVMVFSSGKYHLTGGKNIQQIHRANDEIFKIINENIEIDVEKSKPEIRNLVYRGEFDKELDLVELASDFRDSAEYHPEKQPGLKYRSETISGLMTVFRTGRFTIIGVTDENDAKGLIEEFQTRISTLMSN